MVAFQARVRQARKDKTIPANSPVGDHQANERAEKGVQVFQNVARRMKLAIESHIGIRLPHRHPVLMWVIQAVGGAHNRFKDGDGDGKHTKRNRMMAIPEFVVGIRGVDSVHPLQKRVSNRQFRRNTQRGCLARP